jgi:hypothetical protein
LIKFQSRIADPRFRDFDDRHGQNHIGGTVARQEQTIPFACPKPEDLTELMEGLTAPHRTELAGFTSSFHGREFQPQSGKTGRPDFP